METTALVYLTSSAPNSPPLISTATLSGPAAREYNSVPAKNTFVIIAEELLRVGQEGRGVVVPEGRMEQSPIEYMGKALNIPSTPYSEALRQMADVVLRDIDPYFHPGCGDSCDSNFRKLTAPYVIDAVLEKMFPAEGDDRAYFLSRDYSDFTLRVYKAYIGLVKTWPYLRELNPKQAEPAINIFMVSGEAGGNRTSRLYREMERPSRRRPGGRRTQAARRQIRRFERQTGRRIEKIIPDGKPEPKATAWDGMAEIHESEEPKAIKKLLGM